MNKTIAKKISLLILMYLWGALGYAEEKGKIVKYDILSNGDSVSWRTWFHDTYGITFLKEIPQYTYEYKVRQEQMDYNEVKVNAPLFWPPGIRYNQYSRSSYDILTNFFVQLLTYEERQAILANKGELWFQCAVDANGRVCLIPYFTISRSLKDDFTAERLYELARHIKNNVQFPLPPASMTFGCMFISGGIFSGGPNYHSGILYENINKYD